MNKAVHIDELPFAPTETPSDVKPKPSPPLAHAADPDAFDWETDDSVVLREQRATAVYRNKVDEVIIRQRGPWPDEDTFLYIASENVVSFMEGMAEQLKK